MSLIRFKLHEVSIGYVRNQKCASTTILNYFSQLLFNESPEFTPYMQYFVDRDVSYICRDEGYDCYAKQLAECDIRIGVYRDPVAKFVSGFQHAMFALPNADALWKPHAVRTLETFVTHFNDFKKHQQIRDHCMTNTWKLGTDRSAYTHVFDYRDTNDVLIPLLKEISGKDVMPTKLREYGKRHEFTYSQLKKIKEFLAEDYVNGWF
jgi:hypothetical protein